jgi:hypothetical protein
LCTNHTTNFNQISNSKISKLSAETTRESAVKQLFIPLSSFK